MKAHGSERQKKCELMDANECADTAEADIRRLSVGATKTAKQVSILEGRLKTAEAKEK